MQLHNLATEHTSIGDGNKTSFYYTLTGFTELKPVTREEKKAGIKQTRGPVVISRKSLNDFFGVLESIEESVDSINYGKLQRLSERKLAAGISPWIVETQENNDTPEFFRAVLTSLSERMTELNRTASTADPDSDCKRRFVKAATYEVLINAKDPASLVLTSIETEIQSLIALKEKASTITAAAYLQFLTEKHEKNGEDEDGYTLLRGKAE